VTLLERDINVQLDNHPRSDWGVLDRAGRQLPERVD
jgi:hypothetical protein